MYEGDHLRQMKSNYGRRLRVEICGHHQQRRSYKATVLELINISSKSECCDSKFCNRSLGYSCFHGSTINCQLQKRRWLDGNVLWTDSLLYMVAWSLRGLFMVPAWSLYGPCMIHAWSLYGPCMLTAWSMHGSCMVPAWSLHGPCTVPAWSLHHLGDACMNHASCMVHACVTQIVMTHHLKKSLHYSSFSTETFLF